MTPAVNISQWNYGGYAWTSSHNGVVTGSGSGVIPYQWKARRRPASINNPIRADGTRRPSNWTSEWINAAPFTGVVGIDYTDWSGHHVARQTGPVCLNFLGYPNVSTGDGLLVNTRHRALSKATESTKQLNAALAQMKGTVALAGQFSRAASTRLDAIMSGRKGLFRRLGPMSGWRELPSEYLAYLYGIAPLGDDLANALDRLAWMNAKGFALSMILKSKGKLTETFDQPISLIWPGGTGIAPPSTTRIMGRRHIEVKVGYRFDIPAWYLDQTPVRAPFSTAYELTPYSFVLDWFLPVGNWLGALESMQYSPFFVEGFESTFIQESFDASDISYDSTYGYYCRGSGRANSGVFRRISVSSPPVFSLPALKPLPGLNQAAQGLALLTQAFKRWG